MKNFKQLAEMMKILKQLIEERKEVLKKLKRELEIEEAYVQGWEDCYKESSSVFKASSLTNNANEGGGQIDPPL